MIMIMIMNASQHNEMRMIFSFFFFESAAAAIHHYYSATLWPTTCLNATRAERPDRRTNRGLTPPPSCLANFRNKFCLATHLLAATGVSVGALNLDALASFAYDMGCGSSHEEAPAEDEERGNARPSERQAFMCSQRRPPNQQHPHIRCLCNQRPQPHPRRTLRCVQSRRP